MIPNNLDETLAKNQASDEIIDGLRQALLHIKTTIETQNEFQNIGQLLHSLGFKKKRFEKKIVYTVNASINEGAHRFVFEKLTGEEGIFFVLRDVALHHNYDKALRWRTLNSINVQVNESYLHSMQFTTLACSEHYYDEIDIKESQLMISYGREYISLSNIQTSVLNQALFPQLLIGPPGSGKTLLIHAFFQEQVLQHRLNETKKDTPLQLLYLTKNSALVENIKQSWNLWKKTVFGHEALNFEVSFKTIDDFHQQIITDTLSNTHQNIASKEDYLKKLKRLLKDKKWKRLQLPAIAVLEEIEHSGFILNSEINSSFADSNYRELGRNQITVEKEWQADIFELFKSINLQMATTFSISNYPEEKKYDLVCVDESQQLSLQQLTNALAVAKNGQILYCGDSNQRGEISVSSLPLFIHYMRRLGNEMYQTRLPDSHRLKPRTARLVSELVKLEGTLRGGLVDNTAYASLVSAHIEDSDDSVCWVDEYSNAYTNLKNKASIAVLVLTQGDMDCAKQLTGCETVMLADEVHGLEFDEIFVFVSQKTQNLFKIASQKMLEKGITPLTELVEMTNQSPTKNAESKKDYAIFSKLFIALSRSLNRVHLYFDGSKKILNSTNTLAPNRCFLSWLKYQCHEQIQLAVESSTQEEWLTFINQLINTRDTAMIDIAKLNLKSQLNLSPLTIHQYVSDYAANLSSLTAAESLTWLQDKDRINLLNAKPKESNGALKKPLTSQSSISRQKESNAIKNTSYASATVLEGITTKERYLLGLWNKYTNRSIEALLEHKSCQNLLFSTLMPTKFTSYNGDSYFDNDTLFDNILMSPNKLDMLVNVLKRNKTKPAFSDFLDGFKRKLKSINYCDDFRIDTEQGEIYRSRQYRMIIFTFWSELTIDFESPQSENSLTTNDLIPENKAVAFVLDAIDKAHFLDVLTSDAALHMIKGYDFAHALFYYRYIEKTKAQTYFFFKLFNDKEGLTVLIKWIDKFVDYPNMISVAKKLLLMNVLSPEQNELLEMNHLSAKQKKLLEKYKLPILQQQVLKTNKLSPKEKKLIEMYKISLEKTEIKKRILLQSTSYLFSKIEKGTQSVTESLKDILSLVQNKDVVTLISENINFQKTLLNLKLTNDMEISRTSAAIMKKCANTHENSQSIFLPLLNDLLPMLSENPEQEHKEHQYQIIRKIASICSLYESIGIIDTFGIMPSLMPFLQKIDRNMEAALWILRSLSKSKENHSLFITMQLPEILLTLVNHEKICITTTSLYILTNLIKIDVVAVCESLSSKTLLNATQRLCDCNEIYHEPLLTLLKSFPLHKFITDDNCTKLQENVLICLRDCLNYEIICHCLEVLGLMIDAGFKPVILDTKTIKKLLTLSIDNHETIRALVNPILNFVKNHNGNAFKLNHINIDNRANDSILYYGSHTMFSKGNRSIDNLDNLKPTTKNHPPITRK